MLKFLVNVATDVWGRVKEVGDEFLEGVKEDVLIKEKKQVTQNLTDMDAKFKALDKDFEKRTKLFSERQRKLDETEMRLLRDQERLRQAEADLEKDQRNKYHTEEAGYKEDRKNYEQIAKLRTDLTKQLERYEQGQHILRCNREKCDKDDAEHRQRLQEDYETLKQNQSQIIQLLKTLPAVQKVKELVALIDVIVHNCAALAKDPEALLGRTEMMQSKYSITLMEVRNAMIDGHFFPGSTRVWVDGVVLDLYMLGFMASEGVVSNNAVDRTKRLYQGYWLKLKFAHTKHRPVTEGSGRLQKIEDFFTTQLENFDQKMSASMSLEVLQPARGPRQLDAFPSTSNRVFGAAGDPFDHCLSLPNSGSVRKKGTHHRYPALRGKRVMLKDVDSLILERKMTALSVENDGWDDDPENDALGMSEELRRAKRSSARTKYVAPSASGSAYNRGGTLAHGPRVKPRCSQNPDGSQASVAPSRSKRKFLLNQHEFSNFGNQQNFRGSDRSSRGPHQCKGEWQHDPESHDEISEESGSSNDEES